MQTQTNNLLSCLKFVVLFARYKVRGCLSNKLNLNSPHVLFRTCFFNNCLYRARLKQGGWSGIRLTLSKCEMYPPKLRFSPPESFNFGWADALRELIRKNFKGAYPQAVFQNGILTHPILRWKTKCPVKFSVVEIFGSLVIQRIFMTVMSKNFWRKRKCVVCVFIRSRFSWTQGA